MTDATNIDREQTLFSLCLKHSASDWPHVLAENCEVQERVLRFLEHRGEPRSVVRDTVHAHLACTHVSPRQHGIQVHVDREGETSMSDCQ